MCGPQANVKQIAKVRQETEGLGGVDLNNLTFKGQRQMAVQGALQLPALSGVPLDITRNFK